MNLSDPFNKAVKHRATITKAIAALMAWETFKIVFAFFFK